MMKTKKEERLVKFYKIILTGCTSMYLHNQTDQQNMNFKTPLSVTDLPKVDEDMSTPQGMRAELKRLASHFGSVDISRHRPVFASGYGTTSDLATDLADPTIMQRPDYELIMHPPYKTHFGDPINQTTYPELVQRYGPIHESQLRIIASKILTGTNTTIH